MEPHERVRLKKLKALEDSSEEEDEDGEYSPTYYSSWTRDED